MSCSRRRFFLTIDAWVDAVSKYSVQVVLDSSRLVGIVFSVQGLVPVQQAQADPCLRKPPDPRAMSVKTALQRYVREGHSPANLKSILRLCIHLSFGGGFGEHPPR